MPSIMLKQRLSRSCLLFTKSHCRRHTHQNIWKYSFSAASDGDRMVVECVDVSIDGLGICKNVLTSQVVFVPDAYPGEVADIEITGKKKKITFGSKVATLKPHDGKCEPYCKHASSCGGCQLQAMEYQEQLRLKAKKVRDAFNRIGGVDISGVMEAIEESLDAYHYRNKVEFSIDHTGGILGKHIQGSSTKLIEVGECKLQSKVSHEIYKDIREYAMNDRFLLQEIHHIVIRWSQAYATALVNIVTKRNIAGKLKRLGQYLSEKHGERLTGVVNSVTDSTRPVEQRRIMQEELVCGKEHLLEKLGSCSYRVSPNSFFQVHTAQTEKMYDFVSNAVNSGVEKDGVVLDLYCGAGTIAIFLAQKAKYVYGIEISESSINDARYNATLNNAKNVEFVQGDVGKVIGNFSGIVPDAIVVDPARKGLSSDALQGILSMNPKRIVYVSCHVATQARDVKQILNSGRYTIVSVKPFDLFPQTIHVENVVICKRRDGV